MKFPVCQNAVCILTFEAAADEGVADVIRNTCTDRGVVDDAAVRVVPAHPGAGVNTLSPKVFKHKYYY